MNPTHELVCVHRWSNWSPLYRRVTQSESTELMEQCDMRTCGLCSALQWRGDPEPRVVIGRLEAI